MQCGISPHSFATTQVLQLLIQDLLWKLLIYSDIFPPCPLDIHITTKSLQGVTPLRSLYYLVNTILWYDQPNQSINFFTFFISLDQVVNGLAGTWLNFISSSLLCNHTFYLRFLFPKNIQLSELWNIPRFQCWIILQTPWPIWDYWSLTGIGFELYDSNQK